MTLAGKFVGMSMKKVTEQISSGSVVTAAIEITDAKDASKAVDMIKKAMVNSKGSILLLMVHVK